MIWIKRLALAGLVLCALVVVALRIWGRTEFLPDRSMADIRSGLADELAAEEVKTRPRTPLFDERASGTAWEHYLRAMELIFAAEDGPGAADRSATANALQGFDDPDRLLPESLVKLLRDLEPAWLEVRRGACASAAGRVLTPRDGWFGDLDDGREEPHNFARHLCNLARARAAFLAPTDPDQAIETLMILHRFGEDFPGGGMAISWILGGSIRDEALQMMGRLVTGNFLTSEQIGRVLAWLDRIPDLPPRPLEIGDAEVLYELRSIDQVALAQQDSFTRQSHYRVLDYFRTCWARARESMSDQGVAAVGEEYRRLLLDERSALVIEGNPFARKLVDKYFGLTDLVFEKLDQRLRRCRAVRAAVTLLIHAHRFEDAEGRYPATLKELLATIPGESFSTEEIVYRLLPGSGAVALFWRPDLEREEAEGRTAQPLARIWPD